MKREGVKHGIRSSATVRYVGANKYSTQSTYHSESTHNKLMKCHYCGKRKDCCMIKYEPNHWAKWRNSRNIKERRYDFTD